MPYSWIEISKNALKHNITQTRTLISNTTKLIAVVKANAYGHGLVEVSDIIADDIDYLAVVNSDEARQLRKANIHTPILVLGYITEDRDELQWLIQERVEVVVNSLSHAQRISKLIDELATSGELRIHVKLDTGMGRMGILPENSVSYIKKINQLPHLHLKGVESHFADVVNHKKYAQEQLQKFLDIKYQLFREKIEPSLFHIAKTEAIFDYGESHLDAVRLGIGLYGLWPDKKLIDRVKTAHPEFLLKRVLSWKCKILQVKEYPKDTYIGYGCTYKTKHKTKIAILPVGYYEGYDRRLSNKGEVLIRGKRCPILGRVCMNMSMVDVTDVSGVKRSDEAVLIGKQEDEEITADEMAEWLDTINYEVVTRINPDIERVYVQ
jgi:alanine racemase